jgi:hypothetical protein
MERKPFFEKGDIIMNLKRNDPRVILSITEGGCYEFMSLLTLNFHDVFGNPQSINKGDIGTQPIDIVEKYFCLYQFE